MTDQRHITELESCVPQLVSLHTKANAAGCSWALHHQEAAGEWYVEIDSAAPAERLVTKDYGTLSIALAVAIEHLDQLLPAGRLVAKLERRGTMWATAEKPLVCFWCNSVIGVGEQYVSLAKNKSACHTCQQRLQL